MSEAARAQLAPNGRLRAALNYSNFLLVSARTPEHTGVAPDLARELARRAKCHGGIRRLRERRPGGRCREGQRVGRRLHRRRAGARSRDHVHAGVRRDRSDLPRAGQLADPNDRGRGSRRRAHRDGGAGGLHVVPAAHAAARDAGRGRRDTGFVRSLRRVAPRRAGGPASRGSWTTCRSCRARVCSRDASPRCSNRSGSRNNTPPPRPT